jgi:hypothetical protein
LVLRVPLVLGGLWIAGLQGVAYARAFAEVADTIIAMTVVTKITGLTVLTQLRGSARSIAAVAIMLVATWPVMQLTFGSSNFDQSAQVATALLVGGVSYVGAVMALWMASGRPEGPEIEIVRLLGSFRSRRHRARATAQG